MLIATKFGFDIDLETGERRAGTYSRREHIKAVVEASLKRLRIDRIDLLYRLGASDGQAFDVRCCTRGCRL